MPPQKFHVGDNAWFHGHKVVIAEVDREWSDWYRIYVPDGEIKGDLILLGSDWIYIWRMGWELATKLRTKSCP